MDQIYAKIVRLQQITSDWLDDQSAPAARALTAEVQKLEDETQVRKNPQTLAGRVQSVIRILKHAAEENVIDHRHADELIDRFEEIFRDLKKL